MGSQRIAITVRQVEAKEAGTMRQRAVNGTLTPMFLEGADIR